MLLMCACTCAQASLFPQDGCSKKPPPRAERLWSLWEVIFCYLWKLQNMAQTSLTRGAVLEAWLWTVTSQPTPGDPSQDEPSRDLRVKEKMIYCIMLNFCEMEYITYELLSAFYSTIHYPILRQFCGLSDIMFCINMHMVQEWPGPLSCAVGCCYCWWCWCCCWWWWWSPGHWAIYIWCL